MFFCVKIKFKIYLFAYGLRLDSAMLSLEKVAFLRAGSLYRRYFMYISYALYHQVNLMCFSGRRLTASLYSRPTVKQLDKILTAYDLLLIPIDCSIARFITSGFITRVSCSLKLLFKKNRLFTSFDEYPTVNRTRVRLLMSLRGSRALDERPETGNDDHYSCD